MEKLIAAIIYVVVPLLLGLVMYFLFEKLDKWRQALRQARRQHRTKQ